MLMFLLENKSVRISGQCLHSSRKNLLSIQSKSGITLGIDVWERKTTTTTTVILLSLGLGTWPVFQAKALLLNWKLLVKLWIDSIDYMKHCMYRSLHGSWQMNTHYWLVSFLLLFTFLLILQMMKYWNF